MLADWVGRKMLGPVLGNECSVDSDACNITIDRLQVGTKLTMFIPSLLAVCFSLLLAVSGPLSSASLVSLL